MLLLVMLSVSAAVLQVETLPLRPLLLLRQRGPLLDLLVLMQLGTVLAQLQPVLLLLLPLLAPERMQLQPVLLLLLLPPWLLPLLLPVLGVLFSGLPA